MFQHNFEITSVKKGLKTRFETLQAHSFYLILAKKGILLEICRAMT